MAETVDASITVSVGAAAKLAQTGKVEASGVLPPQLSDALVYGVLERAQDHWRAVSETEGIFASDVEIDGNPFVLLALRREDGASVILTTREEYQSIGYAHDGQNRITGRANLPK